MGVVMTGEWLSLANANGEVRIRVDCLEGIGPINKPKKDKPAQRQLYLSNGFTAYCLDSDENRAKLGLSLDRTGEDEIIAALEAATPWGGRKPKWGGKKKAGKPAAATE